MNFPWFGIFRRSSWCGWLNDYRITDYSGPEQIIPLKKTEKGWPGYFCHWEHYGWPFRSIYGSQEEVLWQDGLDTYMNYGGIFENQCFLYEKMTDFWPHWKDLATPVHTLPWFDPKWHRMENQCTPYGA